MLLEPTLRLLQVPAGQGIGLRIPPRRADCSGRRPSWYPFVFNVCNVDAPDPEPLTERMRRVPPAPTP